MRVFVAFFTYAEHGHRTFQQDFIASPIIDTVHRVSGVGSYMGHWGTCPLDFQI